MQVHTLTHMQTLHVERWAGNGVCERGRQSSAQETWTVSRFWGGGVELLLACSGQKPAMLNSLQGMDVLPNPAPRWS